MVKTQELCGKSIDMKGWQVRAQVARTKLTLYEIYIAKHMVVKYITQ
jgi:hypothetical protein